jgi:hypothetical protein
MQVLSNQPCIPQELKETTMLVATGMLEPQDIQSLRALLGEIKLLPHVHLEPTAGGIKVFADSEDAARLFRESMHVGVLGTYGWGTRLRCY